MKQFLIVVAFLTLGCQQVSTSTNSALRSLDECFPSPGSIQLEDQIYLCKDVSGKFSDAVEACLLNMHDIYSSRLTDTCQDSFRKDVLDVSFELIKNQLNSITLLQDQEFGVREIKESDITDLFGNINSWYGSIVGDLMFLNETGDRTELSEKIDSLVTDLWRLVNNAHQSEFSINGSGEDSEDGKSKYAILIASKAFEKLMHPELVVKFSTLALDVLEERIALLTLINDFVCLVDKCFEKKSKKSNLANDIEILSKLGSTELGTLKSEDPHLSLLLQSISSHQAKLTDLFLKSKPGYGLEGLGVSSWNRITKIDLDDVPDYLKEWVSFIQNQAFRYKAYLDNGLFSSRPANVIAFDLSKETFNRVNSFTKKITDRLNSKIADIEQVKINHLSQLLDRIRDQETLQVLDLDAKSKQFDFGMLSAELDSLKEAILDDSERFSAYLGMITRMKDKDSSIFNNERLKINSQEVLILSGGNAKFKGVNTKVGDIAVAQGITASDSGSGIINLQILGAWSPTCALKKSGMKFGESPVIVGPEGYQLNFSGESAEIESKTKTKSTTNYEDASFSVSLCLSSGGEVAGNGLSAKACANYTQGQRKETADSESKTGQTSFRNIASFASGLHLPNTPYPDAPAGSLLAVISDKDDTSIESAKSIQVVGRQSSIMLEKGEKLYLVVNDCDEDQEHSSQKISVDISAAVPASQLAEQFLGAMLKSIKSTDSEFSKNALEIFKSGYSTPSELNLLRSNLMAELAIENSDSESAAFNSLMSLYANWVEQWVNQIERKAEIIRLEQQLARLVFDLDRFDVRSQFVNKGSSLKNQLIQMTLSNYDFHIIGRSLLNTVSYANDIFLPIVHIHFPDILSSLSGEELEKLRNVGLYSNMLNIAETFYNVLEQINSDISFENSYLFSNPQPSIVGMKIPHPITYEGGVNEDSESPTASLALAVEFWSMLERIASGEVFNRDSIEFSIGPADLYRPDLSSDSLSCIDTDVIVDSMVLAFGMIDDEVDSRLNNLRNRHSIDLSVGPEIYQVGKDKILRYELASFDGRNLGQFKTGLRFYDVDQPNFESLFAVNALHSGSVQGLSPFTNFSFDRVKSLSKVIKEDCGTSLNCAPFRSIEEAFVLFKVKTTTDFQVSSIEACQ